jgi:hypothetical protein
MSAALDNLANRILRASHTKHFTREHLSGITGIDEDALTTGDLTLAQVDQLAHVLDVRFEHLVAG